MGPAVTPPLPQRGAQCPPAGALEAWSADEPDAAWVAPHLETCPRCAPYVSGLKAQREAFLKARPTDRFVDQLSRAGAERGRERSHWWLLVPMGALAVGLMTVVVRPPERPETGFTFKGARVSVYAQRGSAPPRVITPDEPLVAGDAVRFQILSDEPGFAAVLERDAVGEVSVIAPFGADRPQPVIAGTTTLDDSAILDDSVGRVSFVTIFAPAAFDLPRLAAALASHGEEGLAEVPCDGCRIDVLRYEKVR